MFEPVKVAFGNYLAGFFKELVPTTKPLFEYKQRSLAHAMAWSPGRMVDYAEEMLAQWQKNATDDISSTQGFGKLPVILVAMAKDYTASTGTEASQNFGERYTVLAGDEKERIFKLTEIEGDIRAQVAIFAHDEPTARSIAAQLLHYAKNQFNRKQTTNFCFAGLSQLYPLDITSTGTASLIAVESKNLTILAVDFTCRAIIPFYQAPNESEPNDGKGEGTLENPHGYPVVLHTQNEVMRHD